MSIEPLPGAARSWKIDRRELWRGAVLVAIAMVAVCMEFLNVLSGQYGKDFHHGIWSAGADVLHGRNPFPPANVHFLLAHPNGFVTPAPLAVLGVPFSLIPFPIAIILWNLICIGAIVLALRVMGVRDLRIYLLAIASLPLLDSLNNGQPDAIFAMGAALLWRYRDSSKGAIVAGALIAAKLLAWPLLIWFLVTRRIRSVGVALASAGAFLLGGWALIGFQGLANYPSLLTADAKAFELWKYSFGFVHALSPLGLSIGVTRALALALAAAVALTIVLLARRSDEGWFSAALTFGVLSSPFVWPHYLVLVLVPLALASRDRLGIWLATAYGFWIIQFVPSTTTEKAIASLALAIALICWAASMQRRGESQPDRTASYTAANHSREHHLRPAGAEAT